MEKKDTLSSCSESEEQQMQLIQDKSKESCMEKVDLSKALDASLIIIESNGTESQEQDTSNRSGNDAHIDDADIKPIYNEEPMDEVQTTAEINIFATGQQHIEQPEFNNEGEVDQNADSMRMEHGYIKEKKEHLENRTYKDLFVSIKRTRVRTKDQNDSLMETNEIPTGHRFSIKRTSTVHEKTTSPRSCLRWQPTGSILKTVCLRWVPTRYSLKYRYIVQSYKGRTQSLAMKKTDISENRASRNFDLMSNKKMFDRSRSSLGLHGEDVYSTHSSLVLHQNEFLIIIVKNSEFTTDSNELLCSKLAFQKVPSSSRQDIYITTRV
ncbi:hypothetical protein Tco_0325163 [Tanacetum coccineum]